ncbi:hypothetical protein Q3G72_008954 [Acer saccharum]|nr:hypothetical protein Q3G72_008954 [Acer saccharum]
MSHSTVMAVECQPSNSSRDLDLRSASYSASTSSSSSSSSCLIFVICLHLQIYSKFQIRLQIFVVRQRPPFLSL